MCMMYLCVESVQLNDSATMRMCTVSLQDMVKEFMFLFTMILHFIVYYNVLVHYTVQVVHMQYSHAFHKYNDNY